MTNPNATPDDASKRFSLIEMDTPATKPAHMMTRPELAAIRTPAPAPVAAPVAAPAVAPRVDCSCDAQSRPLAIRGVCPACNKPRTRPAPTASNPLGVEMSLGRGRGVAPGAVDQTAEIDSLKAHINHLQARIARSNSVVAGAKVDAAGIFTGFGGLNPLTRAQLAAVIAEAGAPATILPPTKSAHAQAGRAVSALAARGYVVRAARVPRHDARDQTVVRSWRAKWTVGAASAAANVGDAFGHTLLVVTLTTSDQLVIEGRDDLATVVRADFDAAIAGEVYAAADVSAWLCSVLISEYRAARVGGNWYVRARHAQAAERLCTALSKVWGRDWLLPAIPMATTDQLCAGLVKNFIAEANAVADTYAAETAETKGGTIGARRATTLLGEIRTLAERAASFASMFGESQLVELRTRLAAVGNAIQESTDGIAIRFENIFDELRRDAARE